MLTYDPLVFDPTDLIELERPRTFFHGASCALHQEECELRHEQATDVFTANVFEVAQALVSSRFSLCSACHSSHSWVVADPLDELTNLLGLTERLNDVNDLSARFEAESLLTEAASPRPSSYRWQVLMVRAHAAELEAALTASHERFRAWARDSAAFGALDLYATLSSTRSLRRFRSLVLDFLPGTVNSADVARAARERHPLYARRLDDLERLHRERPRRPGRILVHAERAGESLVGVNLLGRALGEFRIGSTCTLALPRSLADLAKDPVMEYAANVSTAVLRDTDTEAVLETAARLLGDGGASAAEALRLARAL